MLSYIPDVNTCLEHTGMVEDTPTFTPPAVEEGNDTNMPELCNADADNSDSEFDDDNDDDSVASFDDDSAYLLLPS
jgi:hypothetical protein